MTKLLIAIVFALMLAVPASAGANWPYKTCGTIRANGLNNSYSSGGKYRPASCAKAKTVLTTFLRTRHRNIGQWRCHGTGTNGAVLAECTQHNYAITVYDARWGE